MNFRSKKSFSVLPRRSQKFQKSKRKSAHLSFGVPCVCVHGARITKKEHDNDKDNNDFFLAHFSFEFFVRVSVVWYFKEQQQQQLSARRRRKRKEATEKTTSASSGRSGWEKERRNERGNTDEHHVGGGKIVISRRLHSLRRRGPMRENDPGE